MILLTMATIEPPFLFNSEPQIINLKPNIPALKLTPISPITIWYPFLETEIIICTISLFQSLMIIFFFNLSDSGKIAV